jgi:hypothetical protein
MPLARTSLSNRLTVSSGPKLLRSVISPSAGIARIPHNKTITINEKAAVVNFALIFVRLGFAGSTCRSHKNPSRLAILILGCDAWSARDLLFQFEH